MSTLRLTHALAEQVRRFSRALGRARRGDPTGVHQGRVASRRIREMLPLVAAADETRARRTRRDVRRVAAALGAVRELDVTLGLLADRANLAQEIKVRVEKLTAAARYRGDDDAVPTPESVVLPAESAGHVLIRVRPAGRCPRPRRW